MASSYFSYAFPPSPTYPGYTITISQDELNQFYKNDRALFKHLVFNLGWNSSQATHIMALLLWLEKTTKCCRFVSKLLKWPNSCLKALVEEVVMALDCIVSDQFPYTHSQNDLPMVQILTDSEVTLDFFHEKRHGIRRAVSKILKDVCLKAFSDILQQEQSIKELNSPGIVGEGDKPMLNLRRFKKKTPIPTRSSMQEVMYYNPSHGDFLPPPMMRAPDLLGTQKAEGYPNVTFGPHNLLYQKEFLDNEMSEIFSNLAWGAGFSAARTRSGETRDVPKEFPADRTIFMTFSRGYPISAAEVDDFFKRKFGDILEGIYMQEVPNPWQQALYARLVVRSPENLHAVLGYVDKAKFTINGRHAWARKYIYKNPY